MYIEALEDGMTVSFTKNAATSGSLYYSLDKQEWNELSGETPAVNKGEKVYFKGNLSDPTNPYGVGIFAIIKQCNVAGNIMSLLFADNFVGKTDLTGYDYGFSYLFNDCTTIQSAKNLILSATKLSKYCYGGMFQGCTKLTSAPELPATTLAKACYAGMFMSCTSLTTTPELPATTLASNCYAQMFEYCTSLITAPELPVITLTDWCYDMMFEGCTSLTKAPELPATTLANRCYNGMFSGCSSLTKAPKLPAMTLASTCYCSMFSGCSSLTEAPELPATTLPKYCYQNMFSGCTSLTKAPELPATTLADYCYDYMFKDCTKLQVVTKSEFIAFNDINSGFNGTLKDCYMPKTSNVIINLSDTDEVIFNYSDGIYSALREETILTDILSQKDISTLTPEYDLVVTVYDNYPDPHIVNTPNICEHITWAAGQSLEEFAEKFSFDYNNTSISIIYTSRKGGDYYYYD